jgi:hypothetical protein
MMGRHFDVNLTNTEKETHHRTLIGRLAHFLKSIQMLELRNLATYFRK